MTRTTGDDRRGLRPATVIYGGAMALLGLTAFVVAYLVTESVWWALLALFAAGPVGSVLLRGLGLANPSPPASPRRWGPPGPGDLDPRRLRRHPPARRPPSR